MPTTARDLITQALKDTGVVGVGQTPLAMDINDGFTTLKQMIAQWRKQRWLVYVLDDVSITSTGAQSYSIGPGGDINYPRPDRLEAAFVRQLIQANPNQVDFPLQIIQSREQYNQISLKQLTTWPSYIFYDSAFPLGRIYPWAIPQAALFSIHLSLKHQLQSFTNLSNTVNLPEEYEAAIRYNLAIRFCPMYQVSATEELKRLATSSLAIIRASNAQIPPLNVPSELIRPGLYNIYNDQSY